MLALLESSKLSQRVIQLYYPKVEIVLKEGNQLLNSLLPETVAIQPSVGDSSSPSSQLRLL